MTLMLCCRCCSALATPNNGVTHPPSAASVRPSQTARDTSSVRSTGMDEGDASADLRPCGHRKTHHFRRSATRHRAHTGTSRVAHTTPWLLQRCRSLLPSWRANHPTQATPGTSALGAACVPSGLRTQTLRRRRVHAESRSSGSCVMRWRVLCDGTAALVCRCRTSLAVGQRGKESGTGGGTMEGVARCAEAKEAE
jgi:hypothetical protein